MSKAREQTLGKNQQRRIELMSIGIPEILIVLVLIVFLGLVFGGVFLLMRVLGRPALGRKVEALESEVKALRAEVAASRRDEG
ncbi:MAG: hypothetical protein JF614_26240 [Acidobacteria bacterium]|nr:hypothetical protein [Acidobacteriota bacterium]